MPWPPAPVGGAPRIGGMIDHLARRRTRRRAEKRRRDRERRSRRRCGIYSARRRRAPISPENQPSSPRVNACGRSSSTSTRLAAGAHSRNRAPSVGQLADRNAAPFMPSPQRRAPSAAAPWSRRPRRARRLVCAGSVVFSTCCPALVFGHFGQFERDLFRGGIEDDKDRRLPLFHRAEHVGKEAAFRKLPVRFLHFLGGRRQPQHAVRAVRAPSVEPAL